MWTIADQYTHAEDYDLENSRYIEDIPFWVDICRRTVRKGGAVLDMCCGTFREGLAIAESASRNGFTLIGVDISIPMLKQAKAKLSTLSLQAQDCVQLVNGDMENVRVGVGMYDLVLVPFNSFVHTIGIKRKRSTLSNIYAHLKDTGLFLADIFIPDINHLFGMHSYPKTVYEEFSITTGGVMLVRQVTGHYDQVTQVLECMYYYQIYDTLGKGNLIRSYCLPFITQLIFPNEWELLLELAGFKVIEWWGSYNMKSFRQESQNMLFLCEKG